ncbi:MAG: GNAT family N-acetyltransferase, partial [Chloroflexi bacterium]
MVTREQTNVMNPRTREARDARLSGLTTPPVAGLVFRGFRGEVDYPSMLAVIEGSKDADGVERTDTLDDVARNYRHLFNCDPYHDMIFAEVKGQVVGYGRVFWDQEASGLRRYPHFAFLLPEWRGQGIRRAMLRHNQERLRQIAAEQPDDGPRFLEAWAEDGEVHWGALLLEAGYEGVRYGFEMVRPDLENIPDLPLPAGLEVRPVQPEQIPQIWAAAKEAFRDHWGYSENEWEQELEGWREAPTFMPHLWQVAWDGDEVAGMVQNFIDHAQNKEYGRLRGYTEGISVRRPWRRQGVAKALIARSFRLHKDLGMTEAALGVDAQNPNGALQLYKSMGFQVVKRMTTYR